MGLNTPAIIMNDLLHEMERDPDAGRHIAYAVIDRDHFDASALGVKVLPCGHSSAMQIVAVGGNTIRLIGWSNSCHDSDEELLRKLADQMGYKLVKKGSRAA